MKTGRFGATFAIFERQKGNVIQVEITRDRFPKKIGKYQRSSDEG